MNRSRAAWSLIMLAAAAPRANAQAVTLPTIRASKTPEMTLLDQMIRTMQSPAGRPPSVKTATEIEQFNCALAKLALSPYSQPEVSSADAVAKADSAAGGSKEGARATILGRFMPKKHGAEELPDGLVDVLRGAPPNCDLTNAVSQSDVRHALDRYTRLETDRDAHARLDSLERVAAANVIRRDLRLRHWFPARSDDEAAAFWRQPAAASLNIGAISGSNNEGATFTELTSRFLHVFRMSFNTVIASGKHSAASTVATNPSTAAKTDSGPSASTISRFLNGGGLLNIATAYPIVHYGRSSGAADLLAVVAPRFGATLPVLGVSQRDTTLMYDLGTEVVFKSSDYSDGVGVFLQTRLGYAGGSPRFMRLIGDAGVRRTGYQTVTGGVSLDGRFLIALSRTVAGPHSLQGTGWQIGVSLARGGSSELGGSQ